MQQGKQYPNHLLSLLPSVERDDLVRRGSRVPLQFGEVLIKPGQATRHVYFPVEGFVSLIATVDGHTGPEVGLVGKEGMFGVPLALGQSVSPLRAVVQGTGDALRLSTEKFRALFGISPALRRILYGYLYVQVTQLAQFAVCARHHAIEKRLAGWLLMTHDRAQDDTFRITDEHMVETLGVSRSKVSSTVAILQSRELILYRHDSITVHDRTGLEQLACECYRVTENMYRSTLGLPQDHHSYLSLNGPDRKAQ